MRNFVYFQDIDSPLIVSWGVTKQCNLNCDTCYVNASLTRTENELSTAEAKKLLIDQLPSLGKKVILVLSGGEPLLREDILEIIRYGDKKGILMVMGTNGTLINTRFARELKENGLKRIGISIDSSKAEKHDKVKNVPGAFEAALKGIESCKKARLPFGIHTTITNKNFNELPEMIEFADRIGAVSYHIFFQIPIGRASAKDTVSRSTYRDLLYYIRSVRGKVNTILKPTCAPQFYRMLSEDKTEVPLPRGLLDTISRGCIAGISYCRVSPDGTLTPCPYLPAEIGNIRSDNFLKMWQESSVLNLLRNSYSYSEKCKVCSHRHVCGGCRARAYTETGDILSPDPMCWYES